MSQPYRERNQGLDFLRFLSIISVLIAHFIILFPDFPIKTPFHILSFFGVEVFFVLSGFLIGGIILNEIDRKEIKKGFIKRFLIRRWLRTLPNYYLFLLLSIIVHFLIGGGWYFDFRFILFAQNLFTPHPGFMGQAWSLSVEEWFYLSFPFVLIGVSAVVSGAVRAYLISAILFIVVVFLLRIGAYEVENLNWDENIRKVVIFRLDSIAYGIVAAYVWRFHSRLLKFKYSIFIFTCLSLMIYSSVILYHSMESGVFNTFQNYSLLFPATSLSIALVILMMHENFHISDKTISKIVEIISKYSYSLYLSHFSILLPLAFYFNNFYGDWIMWITYWCGSFTVAALAYHGFEKPIMDLRDKIPVAKAT